MLSPSSASRTSAIPALRGMGGGAEVRLRLAQLRMARGELDEALLEIEAVHAREPDVRLAHFLRGLTRHARLIVTDRRGWGCSERFTPGYVPDVDTLTDDILAIMGAVGSERASILATYESTIVASLFAAVYPDRTKSLILVDPQVTYLPTEETPWMPTLARWQEQIRLVRDTWGTLDWWDSPQGAEAEWFSRYARASVTPGGLASELSSYLETDIRAVLPSIRVPTLPLVDSDSFYEVPPEAGRFAANRIPGARVVEHSSQGGHHYHWYARGDSIVDEVGKFLAQIREEEASFDRTLATVPLACLRL